MEILFGEPNTRTKYMDSMHRRYRLLLILTVTALLIISTFGNITMDEACSLTFLGNLGHYTKDGDIIIGAALQLLILNIRYYDNSFTDRYSPSPDCSLYSSQFLRHFLAFDFAVNEINQNNDILPNITLGYDIYDTCDTDLGALEGLMKLLSGVEMNLNPNYDCHQNSTLIGIIGHLLSSPSMAMANLLQVYNYPQISYGATDLSLNDRQKYPFFFRTVPTYQVQNAAIVELLKHFSWNWVGILTTVDDGRASASEALRDEIIRSGGCVDYIIKLKLSLEWDNDPFTVLRASTARVLIVYMSFQNLLLVLHNINRSMVIILSDGLKIVKNLYKHTFLLNGTLLLYPAKYSIPGLKDFIEKATPSAYPGSLPLRLAWVLGFGCPYWDGNETLTAPCSYMEYLKFSSNQEDDLQYFRITFSVYAAVYTLAHAVNNMLSATIFNATKPNELRMNSFNHLKLIKYIQHVIFHTTGGDKIFFDEKGNIQSSMDLINWVIYPNRSVRNIHVGRYHSASKGLQFIINKTEIIWGTNITEIPQSVCSENCPPGSRKVLRNGQPTCCFNCIPCSSGEISNMTDGESCVQCPEDKWPDEKKIKCVKKTIKFLSFEDPFGLLIDIMSIILTFLTFLVFLVFIIHRNTPIVKANNRQLSYIILISLQISFLCPFVFIGRPTSVTCILRKTAFCIIFTIAISSIIAKTVIVLLAFQSMTPGKEFNRWIGKNTSTSIVLLCSVVQLGICIWSVIYSPPFPYNDMKSETGSIILTCNERSSIVFYVTHGYILFLAMSSFLLAFMVRNLPDRFNEAHYITFSMLVFCSVWIAFIPSYLSTKGKYLVAVEVFAILASSAGLLCCIFVPKCYIIVIKPKVNRKIRLCA